LSHGWYVVFTAPIWFGIAAVAGGGRVDEAVLGYPRETRDQDKLRMYARFPQGLPASFPASAQPAVAGAPPLVEHVEIPSYHPPEKLGNGIVGSGGLFEGGKGAWSVGYHHRVVRKVFAMAGYTNLDRDVLDMEQWWIGLRAGDPAFAGAKYIYTSQARESASGISAFLGVMTPTSERLAVGIMVGYDWSGLENYPQSGEFFWTAVLLQLTLFPAE
jgi:hypothetical protein